MLNFLANFNLGAVVRTIFRNHKLRKEMTMSLKDHAFRACYWIADDRQSEILLTAPEHAALSDGDLEAEALAEAKRAQIDLDGGALEIGQWVPEHPI